MSIKAIIFDFGEVLNAPVDNEAAEKRREKLAKKLGIPPEDLWSFLFDSDTSRLWMTGKLDWDEFWQRTLGSRGITDPEEIRTFTEEVFKDDHILHPEMVDLLKRLKGHYRLALLSNSTRTEKEKMAMFLNDFGLPADLFDVILTSTSFGATKPDPAIFREALRRLDVLPEEAIFTDDMADFTASAASVGIHSHTFTTPSSFRRFLEEKGVVW